MFRKALLLAVVIALSASKLFAQAATYSYDALGRLVGVVDASGNAASYNYDAAGNILSIVRYTSSQVSLLSFTPTSGPAGTTVTLSGSNFSATSSQNTVLFNGKAATVVTASATSLSVTVPSGATTGSIKVTSPVGSATSSQSFTVTASSGVPSITGYSPAIVAAGSAVTINGVNFNTNPQNDRLALNGIVFPAPSSATATTLAETVPAAVGSGQVSIQTPGGVSTSSVDLYIPPPAYTAAQVGFTARTTAGTTATVSLPATGKIGMLLIDAAVGQKISVESLASNIPSCTLQLYDSSNTVFGTSVPCSSNSFIDALPVARSGTYTVLVAPSSSYGNVQVKVHEFADVTGTITVGGSSVTIATTVAGQNGVVTFSGTAGQRVIVNVPSATYSSCYLRVLDPTGTQLNYVNCASSQPTYLDLGILTTTGTYNIVVDPQGTDTGSVTFNLYNATAVSGGTVTSGKAVTLTTSVPGQYGSLMLSGTAGQRISMVGTAKYRNGSGAYVYINNPDGTNLTYFNVPTNGTSFLDATTLPTAGTYTISVDPQGETTGSITLTEYTIPADVAVTAKVGSSSVSVSTGTPGQNGSITFPVTAGQHVLLDALSSTYSNCNMRVYDTNNNYFNGLTCSSASPASVDLGTLSVAGTYTIAVDPQGADTGKVTVQLIDSTTLVKGSETFGQPITVTTTEPDQSATFTFSGTSGGNISALANGLYTNGGYAHLAISNPDGSSLTSFNVSNGSQSYLDSTALAQTGTYTVSVAPQYGSTGSTTVTIHSVPSPASVTATVGGAPVTVTTTVPGQNAMATFKVTAGQHVLFSTLSSSYSNCSTTIKDPNANVIASPSCAYSITNETDLGTLTTAGTYTVTIDPQGANTGSLRLQTQLYGGASGTTIVIGGAPVPVTATTAGQTGTLTFSGSTGQRIELTGYGEYPSGGSARVIVEAPDSSVLSSVTVYNSSAGDLGPLTLPSTGTYQLLVEPASTTTGTTLLSLYSVPADVTATAVSGKAVVAVTSAPGQKAVYTFSGTAGNSISLSTIGSYSQNGYAFANVLGPDGSSLTSFYVYSGSSAFTDQLALPSTGTYSIQIQPLQGASGQTTLTLYQLPADVGISTSYGAADVKVTIGTPGQNGEVTFSGTAGDHVIWYADTASFSNCGMQAFAPDGTYLNSLQCYYASPVSIDLGILSQTGTYTLFVNPVGGDVGSVSLRVANAPVVNGGTLASGTPKTATTTVQGQQAKFSFQGTAGQQISLTAIGNFSNAGYATASINKPFGGQLTSIYVYDGSTSFLDATVLPSTGTYTVVVTPVGQTTGSSTLTLYALPASSTVSSTVGGPAVTVTTTKPGQNGSISLPVSSGQHVIWSATSSTYLNCNMRLYDPNQNYVGGLTCSSTVPTYLDLGTLNTAGTYTVIVDPQGTDTGSVTVSFANATTVAGGALVSGTTVKATNTVQDQQTKYTFTGTAGQTISMLASASYINSGYSYVYLYEPDGTMLTYFSVSNGGSSFLGDTVLPVSGTYVVLVAPQGATVGTTTLTLYSVPAPASATATVGGAPVSVKTTVPGQGAVVSFKGTAGQSVTVVVTGNYALNGYSYASVQLAGQALANFNVNNEATATAGPISLTTTGTYTIVITPYQTTVGTSTVSVVAD